MNSNAARKRVTSAVSHLSLVPPLRTAAIEAATIAALLAGERRHRKRRAWIYAPLTLLLGALIALDAPPPIALAAMAALWAAMLTNAWIARRDLAEACLVVGVSPDALRRAVRLAREQHGSAGLRRLTPPARELAVAEVAVTDARASIASRT